MQATMLVTLLILVSQVSPQDINGEISQEEDLPHDLDLDPEEDAISSKSARGVAPCLDPPDTKIMNEGEQVNLPSPNYPRNYPKGIDCGWKLEGAETDIRFIVSCDPFEVRKGKGDQCKDFLSLDNEKFCGKGLKYAPKNWLSSSNILNIHFHSKNGKNKKGKNHPRKFNCTATAYKYVYGDLCYRNCSDSVPWICWWKFVIGDYYTMSSACSKCSHDFPDYIQNCSLPQCNAADGVARFILTVNRAMPGPAIEVCKGDRVIFDVYADHQLSDTSTIHWHGQTMKGYQFFDGVPFVTQWPIVSGPFRYNFVAAIGGTTFWHSHVGLHYAYGVYGSFIVRQEHDPSAALYDVDNNTLILQDWYHTPLIAPFIGTMFATGDLTPDTILVNGKGRNTTIGEDWPIEVVKVTKGLRYRLRFIFMGVTNCPIIVSIDNHTMTLIAADAHDIIAADPEKNLTVEAFIINVAERYDVVINANQDGGNYWIRFDGLNACSRKLCVQGAILRYDNASDTYPSENLTYDNDTTSDRFQQQVLNPFVTEGNDDVLTIMDLNTTEQHTVPYYVDKRFNLNFANQAFSEPFPDGPGNRTYFQINNKTFKFPLSPPMVQPDDPQPTICVAQDEDGNVDPKFCHDDSNGESFCNCTYVFEVDLGDWVQMVLTTPLSNHPFHLHGYYFSVVAMGNLTSDGSVPDDIELKLENAVLKDVVTINPKGYTIIRFKADNPGWWFLHCHILFHSEKGMEAILRVGKKDLPIPRGFPQVTPYKP